MAIEMNKACTIAHVLQARYRNNVHVYSLILLLVLEPTLHLIVFSLYVYHILSLSLPCLTAKYPESESCHKEVWSSFSH